MSLEQTQDPADDVQDVDQTTDANDIPEQEDAPSKDDAAFQAGFDSASGIEAEPEPEPEKFFGKYTEADMQALLEKVSEVDKLKEREAKVFGTLGSLKQAIDQLRERPTQAAATQINAKLERMSAEYPEMAEVLRADLSEISAPGPAYDPDAMQKIVTQSLEQSNRATEQRFLTLMHPDWRSIPASEEFAQWKGTLPPDELQIVNDSWDAEAVGNTLTKFKAWKTQATQAKQSRQSRLEAAITPKGKTALPTPSQSDHDVFRAAFNAVKAGKR